MGWPHGRRRGDAGQLHRRDPDARSWRDPGPGWGCNSNKVAPWINPATHQQLLEPSCVPAPAGTLNAGKYPYGGPFRATPVQYVPTIFDRLDAAKLPWRIYASIVGWSICPTFAECEYGPQHSNLVAPTQILTDAKAGQLAAYSVLSPTGPGGTGQHPPSSMLVGDNWIGQVVSAIVPGPTGHRPRSSSPTTTAGASTTTWPRPD